jgi:syntaxin-binding protein 1
MTQEVECALCVKLLQKDLLMISLDQLLVSCLMKILQCLLTFGVFLASGSGWMVLVMDDEATRVISSVLTMYDIMEQRVTLVEQLSKNRQPFREMEVIYLVAPTVASATKICEDFPSEGKSKYGGVHIYFLDVASDSVLGVIQANGILCSKIKTFKEINLHFVTPEANVFHFDMNSALTRLYSEPSDPTCNASIAEKLATLCITLNEFPTVRYQLSSSSATEIATTVVKILSDFKRNNPGFWCHGEDSHQDKERGQLLIVDRSFDALSPLMHEYTYQAMVNDLLPVQDGVISYKSETNASKKVEKQVLLNEADEYWVQLRHEHIAKVIEVIKERMSDIINNNPGAALAKNSGSDMSITSMAAAVKALPEYRETMAKLSQHVNIAQQCMDVFSRTGLMEINQLEQTMSTGVDEEGKEVKGQKLVQMLIDTLVMPDVSKQIKIRLLAIFTLSQLSQRGGGGATAEDRRRLIQAANLTGPEQQILLNFERLGTAMQSSQGRQAAGGLMSMFRGRAAPKHAATPEGEYADSRHRCRLRSLLEGLMEVEGSADALPADQFGTMGPAGTAVARSVRKYGNNSRFGKNSSRSMFQCSRYMVCIAGGVSHCELRSAHDLMVQHSKEVVIGGTHIVNPSAFLKDVASLSSRSAEAMALFEVENPSAAR